MTEIKDISNSTFSMDWCTHCAMSAIESTEHVLAKYKMFAWIVTTTFKQLSDSSVFEFIYKEPDQLEFLLNLKSLEENEALESILYDVNYWEFLKNFITVQLDNNNYGYWEAKDVITYEKESKVVVKLSR